MNIGRDKKIFKKSRNDTPLTASSLKLFQMSVEAVDPKGEKNGFSL
jgi:hypothetical protein